MAVSDSSQQALTNLSHLFAELNRLGHNGEYEKALKVCNKGNVVLIIGIDVFRKHMLYTCKLAGVNIEVLKIYRRRHLGFNVYIIFNGIHSL